MSIRSAAQKDCQAIRKLILNSISPDTSDFGPGGWEAFIEPNSLEAISRRIGHADCLTLCHFSGSGDLMTGLLTMVRNEKLDQLFVHRDYWRSGIATRLWQEARRRCDANGNRGYYWVRSSTMAVPVYESFGFICKGPARVSHHIRFQLLELGSPEKPD